MKCRLVMDDWRETGVSESIYNTELGVNLSMGDLHSGTAFEAEVELPPWATKEIEAAWKEHGAYPVLRLIPYCVRNAEKD